MIGEKARCFLQCKATLMAQGKRSGGSLRRSDTSAIGGIADLPGACFKQLQLTCSLLLRSPNKAATAIGGTVTPDIMHSCDA